MEKDLFKILKESYLKSPVLRALTLRVQVPGATDKEVVQKVYQKCFRDAEVYSTSLDPLAVINMDEITPLPTGLEKIAQKVDDIDTKNIALFFATNPIQLASMLGYTDQPIAVQAERGRKWLSEHAEELSQLTHLTLRNVRATSLSPVSQSLTGLESLYVDLVGISELYIPDTLTNLRTIYHYSNLRIILPDTLRLVQSEPAGLDKVKIQVTSEGVIPKAPPIGDLAEKADPPTVDDEYDRILNNPD